MGDNVQLRRSGRRPHADAVDLGTERRILQRPAADLVLPVIDDPQHGAAVVNVETQERASDSLLARVKSLLRVRRQHTVFGRGTIVFLPCDNPRVLVFQRTCGDETIVVVANLARSPQAATIEFPATMSGCRLEDLIDRELLPPVGAAPYAVTLVPQACRWLRPVV